MRKARRGLFALVLLLIGLHIGGASAAKDVPIVFSNGARDAQVVDGQMIDGISTYPWGSVNYLFIPADWDRSRLRVTYTGYESLSAKVNGEMVAIQNGETTSLFAATDTLTLYDGKRKTVCKIKLYQGSLPSVFIATESGSLKGIHASKKNVETGRMLMSELSGEQTYNGELREIRLRGNTTAQYAKKPYQIKLKQKTELIPGAGKARTWVLLADYIDLTLLLNRITLDMAQYVGMRYAVSSRSVDLYVNGQYKGVYLLAEKVQVNPSRVDIVERDNQLSIMSAEKPISEYPFFKTTLKNGSIIAGFDLPAFSAEEDITGGYLLEIDKAWRVKQQESHGYVMTEKGFGVIVASPDYVSRAQVEYLESLLNAFERAIYAKDGVDAQTGAHYTELADLDSFALKYLLEDVSANFDYRAGSQYFYKDSDTVDGKLYAGPGWDYDLTFANGEHMKPEMEFVSRTFMSGSWWRALYNNHADFRKRVNELYQALYIPALEVLLGEREPAEGMALRSVDAYNAEIAASAEMNFIRNRYSTIKGNNRSIGTTHEACIRSLKKFIARRMVALAAFYAGE